jgi:hypothetical protein
MVIVIVLVVAGVRYKQSFGCTEVFRVERKRLHLAFGAAAESLAAAEESFGHGCP